MATPDEIETEKAAYEKAQAKAAASGGRFASLASKISAVEAAVVSLGQSAESTTQSMKKLSVFREEMAQSRANANSSSLSLLLGNEATSGLMESYLLMLSVNPSHPDISKAKQAIRDWSNVDESFFTWIERFFRDSYREKQKMKQRRNTKNQGSDPSDLVDDFLKMVQLGKL